MGDKTCGVDFIAGFLVGALFGAAGALLLAPQSGDETRTLLRERGLELREQAGGLTDEARQRGIELSAQARERADALGAQVRERADGIQTQLRHAVEEGRTAASRTKSELLSRLEEEQSQDQGDVAEEPEA